MTILFRSQRHALLSWNSPKRIPGQGDDWSDIVQYIPGDDPRDILWKKTYAENIYRKKRNLDTRLSIICLNILNPGDDFTSTQWSFSRNLYKDQAIKSITQSAKKLKYPVEYFTGNMDHIWETLLSEQKQNTLMIILTSDYAQEIPRAFSRLAMMNDIVWIHLYHPWELSPTPQELFFWKVFSPRYRIKYKNTIENFEKQKTRMLEKHNISPIFQSIDQNIEDSLNHFFKYRYAKR